MAVAIIRIEDRDDGQIRAEAQYDPARHGDEPRFWTPAQRMAERLMNHVESWNSMVRRR